MLNVCGVTSTPESEGRRDDRVEETPGYVREEEVQGHRHERRAHLLQWFGGERIHEDADHDAQHLEPSDVNPGVGGGEGG